MSIEQSAADAGLSGPRRYRVDWERVETSLGTRLPSDYKEYVYWFGPGGFDEYLYICAPGVENSGLELEAELARAHKGQRLRAQINRRSEPLFPLFPEPGGWLPWGFVNGGVLYWVTSEEDPDRWTVAGRQGVDLAYFEGGFAEFLHEFIWDTIQMPIIAETESEVPIAFEPHDGRWRGGGATERLEPYGYFEEAAEG